MSPMWQLIIVYGSGFALAVGAMVLLMYVQEQKRQGKW